jgi:hypothetical protein
VLLARRNRWHVAAGGASWPPAFATRLVWCLFSPCELPSRSARDAGAAAPPSRRARGRAGGPRRPRHRQTFAHRRRRWRRLASSRREPVVTTPSFSARRDAPRLQGLIATVSTRPFGPCHRSRCPVRHPCCWRPIGWQHNTNCARLRLHSHNRYTSGSGLARKRWLKTGRRRTRIPG